MPKDAPCFLACRALGLIFTHSSSRSSVLRRLLSCFSSCSSRLVFCSSQARIVALPRDAFAAVEFEYPAGHVIEEIAVVRDGDDRTGILLQVLFEPVDALGVKVVGRFVEQQHVGLLEQQPAKRHAAPFAAGEVRDRFVGVGTAERIHGPFQHAVQFPAVHVVYRFGEPLPAVR